MRRTLTPKFWLWRCDNCGLLAYPPEGDETAEPQDHCPCWKGPRWVRYFAMTPSTPESRDAARRDRAAEMLISVAEALAADIVEPVEEAVARGAIPHDPRENGLAIAPEDTHKNGSEDTRPEEAS